MLMGKLKPVPKSVALLYADDAFDVSVAEGTRELIGKTGLSRSAIDQRYSSKASDFNSILSLIKSQNIDAILVAGHETEILNFIRQAKSPERQSQDVFVHGRACRARISAMRWARTPTTPSA